MSESQLTPATTQRPAKTRRTPRETMGAVSLTLAIVTMFVITRSVVALLPAAIGLVLGIIAVTGTGRRGVARAGLILNGALIALGAVETVAAVAALSN